VPVEALAVATRDDRSFGALADGRGPPVGHTTMELPAGTSDGEHSDRPEELSSAPRPSLLRRAGRDDGYVGSVANDVDYIRGEL